MILMDSLPQKSPLSCEKNFFLLFSFKLRFWRIPQKEAGPMMLFLVDLLTLLRQQSLNFYLATSTLSISSNLNQQLFDLGGETFSIFMLDVTSQLGRLPGLQRKVSDMKRDSSIWLLLFLRDFSLRKRELRWCPALFQLFSPTYTYKWYSPKQLVFSDYLSRRSQLSDPSFFSRLELRRFDETSLFSFGFWVRTAVRQIWVRLNSNEFLPSFLAVELNLMLLTPSFLVLSACIVSGLFISSNSDRYLSSSQRFSRLAKVSLLFFSRSVFGSLVSLIFSTFFSLLLVSALVFCATSASKLLNSFILEVSNSSFSSWASDSQSSSSSLMQLLAVFMVLSSSITSPKRDRSLQMIFKGSILLKKDISSSKSAFPSVIAYLEAVGGRFFCLEARLSFSNSSYSSQPTTNLLSPSAIEAPIFLHSSSLNCLVFWLSQSQKYPIDVQIVKVKLMCKCQNMIALAVCFFSSSMVKEQLWNLKLESIFQMSLGRILLLQQLGSLRLQAGPQKNVFFLREWPWKSRYMKAPYLLCSFFPNYLIKATSGY